MGVGRASEALSVAEKRSSGRAVFAGSVVGVPDLVVCAGNASDSVVVGIGSGADALSSVGVVDEVFRA